MGSSKAASKVVESAKQVVKAVTKKAPKPRPVVPPVGKKLPLSPAFKEFSGHSEMTRQEALKNVWMYIKAHNLQDPNAKKEIVCDAKLKTILGQDRVNILGVMGLLSPHLIKK